MAVVGDRLRFWSVLAEDTEREVTVTLPTQALAVSVSADDLAYAVDALLGNVFAHTPDGTPFSVSLRPDRAGRDRAGQVVLQVADAGPGWPVGDVLQRGVSHGGSTGLGLDIARRTAEASGGSLFLTSRSGGGAEVTLRLGTPHDNARSERD